MFLRQAHSSETLTSLLIQNCNSFNLIPHSNSEEEELPGLLRHNSVLDPSLYPSSSLSLHRCNSEIQEEVTFNQEERKPRRETHFPSAQISFSKVSDIITSYSSNSLFETLQKSDGRLTQDYNNFKLIGRGPQGEVISATNSTDGHIYAIKILLHSEILTKASSRATHELQLMASVKDDEHLVRYYSSWIEQEALLVVMERCESSLRNILTSRRHFTENQIRSFLKDICLGLKNLHSLKIAHLNLKPENILKSANNRFKLADISFSSSNTHSPYSAPEGEGLSADIYSIGVILYEMMTGQSVLHIDFRPKMLRSKMDQLPNFSWSLKQIVLKMLSKDPNNRPSLEYILDLLPNELEMELRWFKEQNSKLVSRISLLECQPSSKIPFKESPF